MPDKGKIELPKNILEKFRFEKSIDYSSNFAFYVYSYLK